MLPNGQQSAPGSVSATSHFRAKHTIFTSVAWICLVALVLRLGPVSSHAQVRFFPGPQQDAAATNARARLPATAEEIDQAVVLVQTAINEAKRRSLAPVAETALSGVTEAELTERQRLFLSWILSLDSQTRTFRRLKEVRTTLQARAAEEASWRGFSQPPPYPMASIEQVRDLLAKERMELQTLGLVVGIYENTLLRLELQIQEDQKEVRRLRDQVEIAAPTERRQAWLLQMAELRLQTHEAAIRATDLDRLTTTEGLAGLRQHIAFLERKLQATAGKTRFTREDLDGFLAQINTRREGFQKELNQAIDTTARLRQELEAVRGRLREAETVDPESPAQKARLQLAQSEVETAEARASTSEMRVEMMHHFVALCSVAQTIWEDRYWTTGNRNLNELRDRRRQYSGDPLHLEGWKTFLQTRLSSVLSQSLNYGIQGSATNLTVAQRDLAQQARVALEEQAGLYQNALTWINLTQELSQRSAAELDARIAGATFGANAWAALESMGGWVTRVWNAELYIAEDSIIANGQKVSVPRSITIGKVIAGLGIFFAALVLARWSYLATRWLAGLRFREKPHAARLAAQAVGTTVALLGALSAMATVRIPWTVFAFMGGALVIGVGFGAQTLITNFLSGLILLFERSIRPGDIVELDDQRGMIMRIGFRNSLIKRGDGVEVLVPNSQFLEKKVVNWTLTDDLVRYRVSIGVAYGSDSQKVAALIVQAAKEHPQVVQSPPPVVLFEDFADNALLFTVEFWMRLRSGTDGGRVRSELRHRIYALLDQAGIPIPFPQRDVYLEGCGPIEVKVVGSLPASGPNNPPSRDGDRG